MDWNRIFRLAPKIKMAVGILDEDSFLNCFEDVISLLNVFEEEQNNISRPFIRRRRIRIYARDQSFRVSSEICRKQSPMHCERVQRRVDRGCWKFKGFVPQLVPKIDRTQARIQGR